MEPSFDPQVSFYTVNVPSSVENVVINAYVNDSIIKWGKPSNKDFWGSLSYSGLPYPVTTGLPNNQFDQQTSRTTGFSFGDGGFSDATGGYLSIFIYNGKRTKTYSVRVVRT